MAEFVSTTKMRNIAVTALATMALSGCGQTMDWVKGRPVTSNEETEILGAAEVEVYVQELGQIAAGDPAALAEVYADASAASTLTPSPSTNLRLGLVLSIPGHSESNPEEAQRLLRGVLSQKLLLTPAEISLATIHLNSAEQQTIAENEARSLRLSSSRAAQTQQQSTQQRLSSIEAENRRLRGELAEAEQKLEAITSIERSINDQE
jgi:hypothetical protein